MNYNGLFYQNLIKPVLQPPDWVFAPIWSALYFLMFVSMTIVLNKKTDLKGIAVLLFTMQLTLNFMWPYVFFGLNDVILALFVLILLIFLSISTLIVFYNISRPAGIILLPYILWLFFAFYLNYEIIILNA